jgi:hypothetical protein
MNVYKSYDKSEVHELVGYDEMEEAPEKHFSISVFILGLGCWAVVKTIDLFAAAKKLLRS